MSELAATAFAEDSPAGMKPVTESTVAEAEQQAASSSPRSAIPREVLVPESRPCRRLRRARLIRCRKTADTPPQEARTAPSRIEIVGECLVVEPCIDQYLYALYERTPKEDTIKETERRKVTVKRRGKLVTVTRSFTELVDNDFTWKDPKAAERVGHVDDGLRDRRHGPELQD